MYVVLLTGSQTWTDPRPIRALLTEIRDAHPGENLVLRHGRCLKGADLIGHRLGVELGYKIDPHPARWYADCDPLFCRPPGHRKLDRIGRLYCPAAGVRRNQYMVDLEPRPDEGVAFVKNNSPGSSHCVRAMRVAGIPVRGRGITIPAEPLPLRFDSV